MMTIFAHRTQTALALAALFGASACTNLLGDFRVEDSPDASGGEPPLTAPDAGALDASTPVIVPDASVSHAVEDAAGDADAAPHADAAPTGCVSSSECAGQACVTGKCEGICAPRSTQCLGAGVQTCGDTGQWGNAEACATICSPSACAKPIAVAPGYNHACALFSSGDVRCWGENVYGQLGSGATSTHANVPVKVVGLHGATAIASGAYFSCAVLTNGSVSCWGNHNLGQGDAGAQNVAVPTPVAGVRSAAKLAAGRVHACALLTDRTVTCWGYGQNGQLGNGSLGTTTPSPPALVADVTDAIALVAGDSHTCVLHAPGTVSCWGVNGHGELGVGARGDSAVPLPIANLVDVSAIAASTTHTCALHVGGSVDCWGSGGFGALGDGKAIDSAYPVAVTGLSGAAGIAAGTGFSCARFANGSAKCWGRSDFGQVGNGSTSGAPTPQPVTGLGGATFLAAENAETCAIVDGGVACWGIISSGQPADGTVGRVSVPTLVRW